MKEACIWFVCVLYTVRSNLKCRYYKFAFWGLYCTLYMQKQNDRKRQRCAHIYAGAFYLCLLLSFAWLKVTCAPPWCFFKNRFIIPSWIMPNPRPLNSGRHSSLKLKISPQSPQGNVNLNSGTLIYVFPICNTLVA